MIKGESKDKGAPGKLQGLHGGLSPVQKNSRACLLCITSLSPLAQSPREAGCLFVMHSTAIHKQIDISLCQPFLFKTMNYSRNITILIRNH